MKRKLLVTFGLVSFISSNAFAMDIVGGKLVSHKEWTTGSVSKASFKDSKESIKKPVLPPMPDKIKNQIDTNQYVYSWTQVEDFGLDDVFGGAHAVSTHANIFENFTDKIQTYRILRNLCIIKTKDMMLSIVGCASNQDQAYLVPQGIISGDNTIYLYANLGEKDPDATYEVQATTYVINESGAIEFASFDNKKVDINSPFKK